MRKKTTANIVKPSRWREYLSIALLVCAILLSFALLSYQNNESTDSSDQLQCTNAVGTIGLTASHWLFKIFGVSVYIFPVLLVAFAVMMFMRFTFPKVKILFLRLLALFGLLITSSCRRYSRKIYQRFFSEIVFGLTVIFVLFLFDTSLRNGWYLLVWLKNAIAWTLHKIYLSFKWTVVKIYVLFIAVIAKLKERFARRRTIEQSNIKTVIVVTGDKKKRKKRIVPETPQIEPKIPIPVKPVDADVSVPTSHQEINEKVEKEIEEILPPYELPSPESLDDTVDDDIGELEQEAAATTEKLKETFIEFSVKADVGNVICGPVITCYEVHPAPGVKVNKITSLENEIAMAMQAKSVLILF